MLGRALSRSVLSCGGAPAVVASVREAREALASQWGGIVLDVTLPDGDGLALAREIREANPQLPLMVLTGSIDVRVASRASELGASFASKLDDIERLRARLALLVEEARERTARVDAIVLVRARRHRLTRAETELLGEFVAGRSRDALAQVLGIAETSVRSRVRGVCRKLGIAHLESVHRLVVAELLASVQ